MNVALNPRVPQAMELISSLFFPRFFLVYPSYFYPVDLNVVSFFNEGFLFLFVINFFRLSEVLAVCQLFSRDLHFLNVMLTSMSQRMITSMKLYRAELGWNEEVSNAVVCFTASLPEMYPTAVHSVPSLSSLHSPPFM